MSRNRITRRTGSKRGRGTMVRGQGDRFSISQAQGGERIFQGSDGQEITPEENERRKEEIMRQGGVFMAVDEATGMVKFSLSAEAEAKMQEDAEAAGLDLDTYFRRIWDEHCARFVDELPANQR